MSNAGQNPQLNSAASSAGQATVNKLNKTTSAQVKNIFSRDVIKNPLKALQVNSDEQKAMQSNRPFPFSTGQPEPGQITQSVNLQLSYNRPVAQPPIPNVNQTIPLSNSPFTSNHTNTITMGSNIIGSNIAIQQTPKNDFKITVSDSNRPFAAPIQNNNIFPISNIINPPSTNFLSSSMNKPNPTIPSGFNQTNTRTSNQNQTANNLLTSINKMQSQKQSVINFSSNQIMNGPVEETANMTLQTIFKHAKFDQNELSAQINPCNIRNTKLLLLNLANKMMHSKTINLSKLKLSPKSVKQAIHADQIYYMLYQYSLFKQQLTKIQQLSCQFQVKNNIQLSELNKKYQRINAASSNIFYHECCMKKIRERYDRIQQQIKCCILPVLQARKNGYEVYSQRKSDFDVYIANQIKESIGNVGNETKEICCEMNSIIENIQEIDEKNQKQAQLIIQKLQDCFKIFESDLQQLTKVQTSQQSPIKQSQTNSQTSFKTKRHKHLIQQATHFLLQIDQLLSLPSPLSQQPQ